MAPSGPSRALAVGLLAAAAALVVFAYVADPAVAQDGGNNSTTDNATSGGATDFTFSVYAVPGEAAWVVNELTVPAGSKMVLVYNSTAAGLPHDIQVCPAATQPGACATATPPTLVAGTPKSIMPDSPPAPTPVFALPEEGLVYVCSVHPEMVGHINAGEFTGTGGGGGDAAITHAGVHYLAYWVGVISFALMFVVYGTSFFLFKHGETGETTDQKDRPGFDDKRVIAGLPEYVWIIIGLVVIALGVTIFFRIMLSGF